MFLIIIIIIINATEAAGTQTVVNSKRKKIKGKKDLCFKVIEYIIIK